MHCHLGIKCKKLGMDTADRVPTLFLNRNSRLFPGFKIFFQDHKSTELQYLQASETLLLLMQSILNFYLRLPFFQSPLFL